MSQTQFVCTKKQQSDDILRAKPLSLQEAFTWLTRIEDNRLFIRHLDGPCPMCNKVQSSSLFFTHNPDANKHKVLADKLPFYQYKDA